MNDANMPTTRLAFLLSCIKELSKIAIEYKALQYPSFHSSSIYLKGYSDAVLTIAVHKQTVPIEFAFDQAIFMKFLGEKVCPPILGKNEFGYIMKYLLPVHPNEYSAVILEQILEAHVWNRPIYPSVSNAWRKELKTSLNIKVPIWTVSTDSCLIHGDPTFDNMLQTEDREIRITDPIPPIHLKRPSIRAIDHGKILQSILGWEVVLRGFPSIEYEWPKFMQDEETAFRAAFWCMIALKRICLRSKDGDIPGQWAARIAKELGKCVLSS